MQLTSELTNFRNNMLNVQKEDLNFKEYFETKTKYKFRLSHLKELKRVPTLFSSKFKASVNVKKTLSYIPTLLGLTSLCAAIVILIVANYFFNFMKLNYTHSLLEVMMLCFFYILVAASALVQIPYILFKIDKVDSKTITQLESYILTCIKKNPELKFDYELIDLHLELIKTNPEDYTKADLEAIVWHINTVVKTPEIEKQKEQMSQEKKEKVLHQAYKNSSNNNTNYSNTSDVEAKSLYLSK